MTVAVQVSPEAEQQCGSTAVSDTPLSTDSFKAARGVSQTAATRLFEYVTSAWNYRKGEHCTYKYTSDHTTNRFCASVTVRLPNRDPVCVTDSEYRLSRTAAQNVVAQKALDVILGVPASDDSRRPRANFRRPNEKVQQFFDNYSSQQHPPVVEGEMLYYPEQYPEYVMTPGPYPPMYYPPEMYGGPFVYYDAYGYEQPPQQYAPQEWYYCPPQYPPYGYGMHPPLPPFPPQEQAEQHPNIQSDRED